MGSAEGGIERPSRSGTRRVGFVLGVILLCAAAVYVLADPSQIRAFGSQIRHAPLWLSLIHI